MSDLVNHMKKIVMYDYKSAKRYIQMHSDVIDEVHLGIHEDWYFTSEPVFENNRMIHDLDSKPAIGGIFGSNWGTPVMKVYYKDGREEFKDCYVGDAPDGKVPDWFSLGALSEHVQSEIRGDYRKFKG